MLRTTLVNCDPDAALASADLGKRCLGNLEPFAVVILLEKFAAIDPVLNAVVDPEVVIETARRKYIVRTGQGRLFLYDLRNALEPAIVLTPEEVVAELDGSAERARSRVRIFRPIAAKAEPESVAPQPEPLAGLRPPHRLSLLCTALCLTIYLVNPHLTAEAAAPLPEFVPAASGKPTEVLCGEIAGVYLTGATPGHHGIALRPDGTMKLFQINPSGNPSHFNDTYRVGHIAGKVCVLGAAPNRLIRQITKGSLSYGGETYQRLP